MWLFILSVFAALSVSAMCSLMEAALLSLTPSQLAQISVRRPAIGAVWQRFKDNIERPIAAILVLNTAAHTIGASVAGAEFDELFGDKWILVFSLVFTYLMLQFTEILPKTLGVKYNQTIAVLITRPLSVLIRTLRPILAAIHWINRPFEGKPDAGKPRAGVEEIIALAGLARLAKQITSHQERIIKGATRLSRLRVREVMIPVQHVSFLSSSMELSQALVVAHFEAHTRFPVCENNDRDRVVGYVNFKELIYFMRTNPNDTGLAGVIRPLHHAAPEDSAADLLRLFVEQHIHIAVVQDPQGRTLGIVALEDLVEELVGEIEDEFDRLPRLLHALSGGTWIVGGGVRLAEVNARLGTALEPLSETLSAWLTRRLVESPKPGDVIREQGITLTVRRVRRGRVFEVVAAAAGMPAAAPPSPSGRGEFETAQDTQ
ncbi:MAG TPA: hemolysin family protein [Candidatus Anammoximicrobium sp.]|nr:hemolysin family protein [Candidatus Anammoximicrobium sp.]